MPDTLSRSMMSPALRDIVAPIAFTEARRILPGRDLLSIDLSIVGPRAASEAGAWMISPAVREALTSLSDDVPGVARSELSVPVCPSPPVRDDVYLEGGADPTQRFYLPRYRVFVENGQPTLAILRQGEGWRLSLMLEAYPAEPLADPATAVPVNHDVAVVLSFRAGDLDKQLPLEVGARDGALLPAQLALGDLPTRDAVVLALRDLNAKARLVIRRTAQVAIPTRTSRPPKKLPALRIEPGRPLLPGSIK